MIVESWSWKGHTVSGFVILQQPVYLFKINASEISTHVLHKYNFLFKKYKYINQQNKFTKDKKNNYTVLRKKDLIKIKIASKIIFYQQQIKIN